MMNYEFYIFTSQSGGEGYVNTQTDSRTDRQANCIGKKVRTTVTETTHLNRLGFSRIIIESDFWWEINLLISINLFTPTTVFYS